jgi:hypothetical protein
MLYAFSTKHKTHLKLITYNLKLLLPYRNKDIQVTDTGKPHQVRLQQHHHKYAGAEEVENAVIHIGNAEDGPIPKQVQEKQYGCQCIVDAGTIVGFRDELITTIGAILVHGQKAFQGEIIFLPEHPAPPALRAAHTSHALYN